MNQIKKALEQLKEIGLMLEFIKEQSETICLAAVKQTGWAL